jgi:hypothetical protein
MAVRLVRKQFDPSLVSQDTLVSTVEKNRDRIRTFGGMLLTLCGMLISASMAFILFLVDKKLGSHKTIVLFGAATLCFVVTALLTVLSSILRTNYAISTREQFLTDLLNVYTSELLFMRCALIALISGLLSMLMAVFTLRTR